LIVAGSLVIPVVAQQLGVAGNDISRAKEIAGLVAIGQLKLADATALAERQVGGTALDARVDLQTDETGRMPAAGAAPGAKQEPPTYGKKLVYDVTIFSKDRIQFIRVDGLNRKVIGVQESKPVAGSPSAP